MQSADTQAGSGVPRRILGQHLRDLRRQAGLTVKLAASLMEWSEPKLWRIETGQTALRAHDVQATCTAYGAPPDRTQALAALASQTRAHGWWRAYGQAIPDDSPSTTPWKTPRTRWRGMRPLWCRACCAPTPTPAP
jgi:hypothetical protein